MFLISDNTETLTGLKLAGVGGVIVSTREQLTDTLNDVIGSGEYAIILYTGKLREIAGDILSEQTESNKHIIFYEIPDKDGYDSTSSISDFVKSSIGV